MIEHIKNTLEEDSVDNSQEDMVPNINSNIPPVPTEQMGSFLRKYRKNESLIKGNLEWPQVLLRLISMG
ncbi:hypothetical protein TNCT_361131 [Trichonephila clavata]|uniref:Uncharacterized protein n=1 Tax=Trichonephila clavata TaxID=2740835 RepID=A0A8X6LV80_TRICU|nr:hypothetical protein TNCT_361131 [Trichonephila clavata]